VPDLPGFGDSGKPEEVLDVTELADWMKPLDSEASLLGDFFGCQVIADLAVRYRVEHAILQGATMRLMTDQCSGCRINAMIDPIYLRYIRRGVSW
jgi:pimeloyl-ACP methyl ester carboxylesterase